MEWFWYAWLFVMLGGAGGLSATIRKALDDRHQRKMAALEAKERRQKELEDAKKPPEPVCGCTHHLAKHDKQGKCHEMVDTPTEWDANRKPVTYRPRQCKCQQYVGPEPLQTFYAEELTDPELG